MKKTLVIILVLALVVLGGFAWLVVQAGPDNAPDEVQTIELPDTYER